MLLGCELGGEFGVRLLERAEPGRAYLLTYHAAELGENIGAMLLLAPALSSMAVTREDDGLAVRYVTQPASGVVLVAEPADGHQVLG